MKERIGKGKREHEIEIEKVKGKIAVEKGEGVTRAGH